MHAMYRCVTKKVRMGHTFVKKVCRLVSIGAQSSVPSYLLQFPPVNKRGVQDCL
uniref:Uncharacterized protein n=1 Tax=Octopus bimaculoides TaxID=37653 RepID=A0A0L8GXC2_OCTBM